MVSVFVWFVFTRLKTCLIDPDILPIIKKSYFIKYIQMLISMSAYSTPHLAYPLRYFNEKASGSGMFQTSNREALMNRKTSTLLSLGISIALIAVGIWFLCNHQNNLGYGDGGLTMPYRMMIAGGGMGIVIILFWVAVLSAIGLVVSGVISNCRSSERHGSEKSSRPVKSLNQHSACGKIEKSQFEAMKRNLS